ncbi:MAG: DsbA family protein [Rhodobacteraceae bacterium]|nr:DsbA family protein [Paracoccaceae bacterium]
MRPTVTYFSDALCIWAYVSQVRLDQLATEYCDRITIEEKFCSVFPDARTKTSTAWKDRGGYEAMNNNFQKMAKKFPHISVHEDVWTKTQPRTSSSIHLFLKAIQLLDGDAAFSDLTSTKAIRQFRTAFFTEARDISDWKVQGEIAEELGLDVDSIKAKIHSSEAAAALDADLKLADKLGVKGSPTFVMNEGRQVLFGNVGYKLIEANVEELFREQGDDSASWC